MTVRPLGESAFLLSDLGAAPYRVAARLNESPPRGLIEAVASYDAVGVYIDPETFRMEEFTLPESWPAEPARQHEVPVCYRLGADLEAAAQQLGLEIEQLVAAHSGTPYVCAAVGFRPGFAYLRSLPDRIAGLPRMAEPRTHVPAGSVGITGRQTGVYPQDGPGGWWLVGQTPLRMVDEAAGYYPIQAGDEVRFVPIDEREYRARAGERL